MFGESCIHHFGGVLCFLLYFIHRSVTKFASIHCLKCDFSIDFNFNFPVIIGSKCYCSGSYGKNERHADTNCNHKCVDDTSTQYCESANPNEAERCVKAHSH